MERVGVGERTGVPGAFVFNEATNPALTQNVHRPRPHLPRAHFRRNLGKQNSICAP